MNLPTITVGSTKLTISLAERVATDDDRARVYGTGFTLHRPDDERGDSVNQLMVGGRFDVITEALDRRRAKADREAVSLQNAEVAEAQAKHGVPVTEPVIQAVVA